MKLNIEGVFWIFYFCFVGLGFILFAINVDNFDFNVVKKSIFINVNILVFFRLVLDKIVNEFRFVIVGEEIRVFFIGKCIKLFLIMGKRVGLFFLRYMLKIVMLLYLIMKF